MTGGHFPDEFLKDIKARVSVSSVVGKRVKLIRKGREFVGLSPFSHEKTPSFTVNDEEAFYHCFSSGEHGDIFTFVQKTQGLTFPEAVELLAGEAGLEVPQRTAADAQKAARSAALVAIVEAACAVYEEALWSPAGAHALAYLRDDRGLSDETIKRFRLGYAPPGNFLKARLIARGVAETLLFEAKLISPGKDGRESFDFFRDRVLFPILDLRGRPVAFGGRVMGDGEPKYLNSGDTALFHKGKQLYGLSLARESAAAREEIIVVEGYMDTIAMAQAGIENTVAPLGTALTETQLALLWRYAAEPILCFDNDKAGRAAAVKAANRALPELKPGFSLRFATLAGGKDPDDICRREGLEAMRAVLDETDGLAEVIWGALIAETTFNTPERRAGFEAAVIAKCREIKDEFVRKQYETEFRERMAALFGTAQVLPFPGKPIEKPAPDPVREPNHDAHHDGADPIDIVGEHCPITVLGENKRSDGKGGHSNFCHFIDTKGEVQSLSISQLRSSAHIEHLFGGKSDWLESMAPNKTADGHPLPG
jgi:DNA primase